MAVVTTNAAQGPGTLYIGLFGATEPADTAVNTTPASSAWTDLGGTQDGVKFTVDQTYSEMEFDQIVDRVGSRLTKRDFMVETSLGEVTMANFTYALNGGTTASGSGYKSYEPTFDSSATQPTYRALIIDAYAENSYRRRIIVRKALSTDATEMSYTKDKQTLFPVKFAAHYVSSAIAPIHIVDATS